MANEELIGYHKGALSTLSKERQELSKMVGVVDQFIKMHMEELKKLGVDLEAEAKKQQETAKEEPKEQRLA
tara:strand:+ start:587 stop:799 length:213 start_codon:yes stop_codon:yes gene_type:complete